VEVERPLVGGRGKNAVSFELRDEVFPEHNNFLGAISHASKPLAYWREKEVQ
jgi:hypothetical protein